MSYFDGPDKGYGWAAGHFLADDEACTRITMTIPADHEGVVTRDNGRKVVPAGSVVPAIGQTAVGILYEDIDVTEGAKMGSVVTEGTVYGDRVLGEKDDETGDIRWGVGDGSLGDANITVIESSPTITRPDYFSKAFVALTVTSTEGATSGKTVISVSGVTLVGSEKLQYKADADPLPFGSVATGFTDFASGDSLTIADGKEVAVIAVTAGGYVFGTGTVTADTKA